MGDAAAAVRAALRDELLRGALLPLLGPAALAPFVPLLMAHVCAAMTHLAEPIRCGREEEGRATTTTLQPLGPPLHAWPKTHTLMLFAHALPPPLCSQAR